MSWSAGDAAPQPAAPQAGLLQGHEDNYDGLIVDDFEAPPGTAAEFADALQGSLAAWRDKGYRGIWYAKGTVLQVGSDAPPALYADPSLAAPADFPTVWSPWPWHRLKLPTTRAHYVGHAVDAGFDFHHAEQVGRGWSRGTAGRRAAVCREGGASECAALCSTACRWLPPISRPSPAPSPVQDYVMLTTWLPTDCENKLPPNASHQVGNLWTRSPPTQPHDTSAGLQWKLSSGN